jgi:voltage-gated potassium channel Kch
MNTIIRSVVFFFRNRPYRSLTISVIIILTFGTIIYHYSEQWKWLDSLYFSVITLTTVGYGDFSPESDFGKIFTVFYVLIGIGIIFGFINTFYQQRVSKFQKITERQNYYSDKN